MDDIIAKALSIRNTIARKANEELQDTGVLSDAFIELLGDNEEHVDLSIYEIEGGKVIGKAGGPSRQLGSAAAEGPHFPPISNTGVSKYQSSTSSSEHEESPEPPSFLECLKAGSREKTIGGYDGGTCVGFDGIWDKTGFTAVMDQLAAARSASESAEHRTVGFALIHSADSLIRSSFLTEELNRYERYDEKVLAIIFIFYFSTPLPFGFRCVLHMEP